MGIPSRDEEEVTGYSDLADVDGGMEGERLEVDLAVWGKDVDNVELICDNKDSPCRIVGHGLDKHGREVLEGDGREGVRAGVQVPHQELVVGCDGSQEGLAPRDKAPGAGEWGAGRDKGLGGSGHGSGRDGEDGHP